MANEFALSSIPPASTLPYPDGFSNRIKYIFWRTISRPFLYVRDILVAVGIVWHRGRQPVFLGTLKSPKSLDEFLAHLQSVGFGNHFIAWKDEGQIISLRLLDGFEYQYHLRIFSDGEVRGHYEFTPESHPWFHFKETGQEVRREKFLMWIGDWIKPMARKRVASSRAAGKSNPKLSRPRSSVRRAAGSGVGR
jgi:hypothetical protein